MADTRKKKTPKERPPAAQATPAVAKTAVAGGATLADHPILHYAMEGFIRDNSNFESSLPINTVVDEIGRCSDLQSTFATPLQHKLFTMDAALRWALFVHLAPDRAVSEGDPAFSKNSAFSPGAALELIAAVYDIGIQGAVWDLFDPEDEDDEEEGGEGAL